MLKRLEATVRGLVQGVFFRDGVARRARALTLIGAVGNANDGSMRVVAEGEKEKLAELLAYLRKGPPLARVTSVEESWGEHTGAFDGFSIVHSSFWDRL
jgi:acylphosphatase